MHRQARVCGTRAVAASRRSRRLPESACKGGAAASVILSVLSLIA